MSFKTNCKFVCSHMFKKIVKTAIFKMSKSLKINIAYFIKIILTKRLDSKR